MRCMLTTNLDVEARFANGTQGRLLCWYPCGEQGEKRRKVVPASHPDLSCRFLKETSKNKNELLADVDHIDVTSRPESMSTVPGCPVMLQLGTVPAYALTVHKTQVCCVVKHKILRNPFFCLKLIWSLTSFTKGPHENTRQALSIKHIVRGCLEGIFAQVRVFRL